VSKTSFDGPLSGRCAVPLADAAARASPLLKTWSTVYPSEDANRKATNVASIKGRASLGLQVRIFRRDLSLKVEEGRLCCRAAVGLVLRLLLVGDEVADVEVEV